MEIRTKFNVGDKVWTIKSKYVDEVCIICEGEKTVKIKGKDWQCPNCAGSGTEKIEKWAIYEEMIIDCIRTYNCSEPIEIRNVNYDQKLAVLDENCFATKEEAQKECDRRNANKI